MNEGLIIGSEDSPERIKERKMYILLEALRVPVLSPTLKKKIEKKLTELLEL